MSVTVPSFSPQWYPQIPNNSNSQLLSPSHLPPNTTTTSTPMMNFPAGGLQPMPNGVFNQSTQPGFSPSSSGVFTNPNVTPFGPTSWNTNPNSVSSGNSPTPTIPASISPNLNNTFNMNGIGAMPNMTPNYAQLMLLKQQQEQQQQGQDSVCCPNGCCGIERTAGCCGCQERCCGPNGSCASCCAPSDPNSSGCCGCQMPGEPIDPFCCAPPPPGQAAFGECFYSCCDWTYLLMLIFTICSVIGLGIIVGIKTNDNIFDHFNVTNTKQLQEAIAPYITNINTNASVSDLQCTAPRRLLGSFGVICREDTLAAPTIAVQLSNWNNARGTMWILCFVYTAVALIYATLIYLHRRHLNEIARQEQLLLQQQPFQSIPPLPAEKEAELEKLTPQQREAFLMEYEKCMLAQQRQQITLLAEAQSSAGCCGGLCTSNNTSAIANNANNAAAAGIANGDATGQSNNININNNNNNVLEVRETGMEVYGTPFYEFMRLAWLFAGLTLFAWTCNLFISYWAFASYYRNHSTGPLHSFWQKYDNKFVATVIVVTVYLAWPLCSFALELVVWIVGVIPWLLIRCSCKKGIDHYRPALPPHKLPGCIRADMFFTDCADLRRLGFSWNAWLLLTGSNKFFWECCADTTTDTDPEMTQLTQLRLAWQQQLLAMMGNWARPGFIPHNLINMAMTNANRIPPLFPAQLANMPSNTSAAAAANLSTPPLSPTSFAQQQQQQMMMSMMMMNTPMSMMPNNMNNNNLTNNDINVDGQALPHAISLSKQHKPEDEEQASSRHRSHHRRNRQDGVDNNNSSNNNKNNASQEHSHRHRHRSASKSLGATTGNATLQSSSNLQSNMALNKTYNNTSNNINNNATVPMSLNSNTYNLLNTTSANIPLPIANSPSPAEYSEASAGKRPSNGSESKHNHHHSHLSRSRSLEHGSRQRHHSSRHNTVTNNHEDKNNNNASQTRHHRHQHSSRDAKSPESSRKNVTSTNNDVMAQPVRNPRAVLDALIDL